MTRHGLSNQAVARNATEQVGDRVPIPGSGLKPRRTIRKTNPDCGLTAHEIALIGPVTALPAWEHLPSQTIPKPYSP